MREIKFRAWNGVDGRIVDWATLKANPDFFMNIIKGVKHYELMQFTVLRDKNGVEIYEGDIVSLNGSIEMWEVYYCKVTKCPSLKMLARHGMEINTFCELYDDDLLERIEVLGNIHQNPELLEAK